MHVSKYGQADGEGEKRQGGSDNKEEEKTWVPSQCVYLRYERMMIGLKHWQSFFSLSLFVYLLFSVLSFIHHMSFYWNPSICGLLLLSPSSFLLLSSRALSFFQTELGRRTKTAVSQNQQKKQSWNSGALYSLTFCVPNREIAPCHLVCACRELHAL